MDIWFLNRRRDRLPDVVPMQSEFGITEFHDRNFHGLAVGRAGENDSSRQWVKIAFDDPMDRSLHLYKNVWQMNEVLLPSTNLVVSSVVKHQLSQLNNIKFCQVIFDKIFSYPYPPYDFSIGAMSEYESGRWFLEKMTEQPEARRNLHPYYEVVCPRYQDLELPTDGEQLSYLNPHSLYYGDLTRLRVTPLLMQRFPILWHPHALIVGEAAYAVLQPFVDARYFVWARAATEASNGNA